MKTYMIGLGGAFIMFVTGGLFGLGIYFLGLLAFWYYMLRKGLNFIRAYLYLKILWQTDSPSMANYVANELGVFGSGRYIVEAMNYADRIFNGMQTLVIQQAKEMGFQDKNLEDN